MKIKKWTAGLVVVAILLAACALKAQLMTGETVPQNQVVLDSYFVTNAVPGQLQYWELIDTMFWYANSTYTNSQAALAAVTNATAVIAASGIDVMTNNSGYPVTNFLMHANNVSLMTFGGSNPYYVTNWFLTPLADTNYGVQFVYTNGAYSLSHKETYCVVFTLSQSGGAWVDPAYFVIYR